MVSESSIYEGLFCEVFASDAKRDMIPTIVYFHRLFCNYNTSPKTGFFDRQHPMAAIR